MVSPRWPKRIVENVEEGRSIDFAKGATWKLRQPRRRLKAQAQVLHLLDESESHLHLPPSAKESSDYGLRSVGYSSPSSLIKCRYVQSDHGLSQSNYHNTANNNTVPDQAVNIGTYLKTRGEPKTNKRRNLQMRTFT